MTRLSWIGATPGWEPAPWEMRRPERGAEIWVEEGLSGADLPSGAHRFAAVPELGGWSRAQPQVIYASGNPIAEHRRPFWRLASAEWSTRVVPDPFAALALAAEDGLWLQPGRPYAVEEGQLQAALEPERRGPLARTDVLVMRSPERARAIVRTLNQLGARTLSCPMWRFAPARDRDALAAWSESGAWDGVLVTSAQAAITAAAAILRVGPAQVAAVGPKTALALGRGGVAVQLIGEEGALSLAAELGRQIRSGGRVAVLRAEDAPRDVLVALSSQGLEVTEVATHRLIPAPGPALKPLGPLVRQSERPWALIFDGRAAEVLALALDEAQRSRLQVAVIGPQTARTARECGLQVAAEAARPTAEELVRCLVAQGGRVRWM